MQACRHLAVLCGSVIVGLACVTEAAEPQASNRPTNGDEELNDLTNARQPKSEAELQRWLQNMVAFHRYTEKEIRAATGLEVVDIRHAINRFGINPRAAPKLAKRENLLLLPYPGGRHPRIGFRNGAVHPQRETKASVFTPWDATSYVVLDVPEVIFSNLGPLYLAHTDENVPTIWDKQGIELPPLEWREEANGVLAIERTLPNKLAFGTRLTPHVDFVEMEMWLTNGTAERLTGLRSQVCVLLRGTPEFEKQTNENKFNWKDYSACRNEAGTRWVIVAFMPKGKAWANAECPCLHADPQFEDCDPGQTVRALGRLSFYEGKDIESELRRIEATNWRKVPE